MAYPTERPARFRNPGNLRSLSDNLHDTLPEEQQLSRNCASRDHHLSRVGTSHDFGTIADAITFGHLLNWDVVEPDRLVRAHGHLKAVTSLSRQSWAAILRESDDDNEWIPSPRQTNRFPGLPVTQDRVDAWLRVLDEFDAVLDGRKLVPHWRLQKGFNLRRALIEHRNFDLVLWTTGPGVAPFAEDGPAVSAASWNEITRAFQGNFFGYAVWFN